MDPDDVYMASEIDTEPLHIPYHPFPSPTRLAAPDVETRLRALGFGYRAKFLAGTAQALVEMAQQHLLPDTEPKPARLDEQVYTYLHSLRSMSYEEAREKLLLLPGIGPKVAEYVYVGTDCSCILLMSLDQASSIPVDRHVFQFAERWYGIRSKKYEEVAEKLRRIWGHRAGWAHSVRDGSAYV
ncbi:8-oxoguanine glycosylase Ogg1 [Malassezia pachydermatis]